MKIINILLFSLLCVITLQAQPPLDDRVQDWTQSGEQHLLKKEYKKALKNFEKALEVNPEFSAALRGRGACHELLGDYYKAAVSYGKILNINPNFSRTLYYEYAFALYRNGNYNKAFDYFSQFMDIKDLSPEKFPYTSSFERKTEVDYVRQLEDNIRACKVAMDSVQYRNIVKIENIGGGINTEADEYFPFLTNDQNTMFYTTRKDEFHDENLYFSEAGAEKWRGGQAVTGSFNSDGNEGMSSLVRDGRKIYFTACERRKVMGTCDLWSGKLEGHKITDTEPIKGYANGADWESQACISCDGTILYFASNRPGGLGGTDIWLSRILPDGRWGTPENLGPNINTPMDEEAPFVTMDGQVLYFSSNGHLGLGEQDIFMSRTNDFGEFSPAINLGPPLNSSYREIGFFLTADGNTGYFASNRTGGIGGMDIYKFELPAQLHAEPITLVEGTVRDSLYHLPVQTTIYFNDRLPIKTDERGRFFRCVPANEQWQMNINQRDFEPYKRSERIPAWDNKDFYPVEILLMPLQSLVVLSEEEAKIKEAVVKEQELRFGTDKFELKPEHKQALDKFLGECLDGKSVVRQVDIVGFADASGGDAYNMMLSERRAKSVAVYLQSKGIRVDRVYLKGMGETSDKGAAGANRRVEIKLYMGEVN